MQESENLIKFRKAVGNVFQKIRKRNPNLSLSKFALEYDLDKSNLSKTERGIINIYLATAWKISEAYGIKFSEFAKLLEDELGERFTFMDV